MSFTRTVQAVMEAEGLAQADLGVIVGLSQQAVSDRMTGRTSWRLAELEALANALNRELVVDLARVDAKAA